MDPGIKEALDRGLNIFLTGAGGVGKSFQSERIIEYLKQNISVCAPTGAAAIQVGGVTIHSLLGQGLFVGTVDSLVERMMKIRGGDLVKQWCTMDTLLIDELSMTDVSLFVRASKVIQAIRRHVYEYPWKYNGLKVSGIKSEKDLDKPWGGIRLILVGDFLQLPPIQPYVEQIGIVIEKGGDGNDIELPVTKSYRYLFEHPIWTEIDPYVIYLNEPKRFMTGDIDEEEANEYFHILGDIRLGILSERVKQFMSECSKKPQAKKFPCIEEYNASITSLTAGVHGMSIGTENKKEAIIFPTVLIATNKEVDKHNMDQLKKLQGEEHTYHATFRCNSRTTVMSKEDMTRSCLAPDPLTLKIGAQVMLLTNKLDLGLCNGSRGVVVGFKEVRGTRIEQRIGDNNNPNNSPIINSSECLPIVQFMNGRIIAIEPYTWSCTLRTKGLSTDEKPRASLTQIPLRLAYALSIHKAQGISLDSVYLSLSSCFAPGQLYVALSRCRSRANTFIKDWDEKSFWKCRPDKKAIEFYANLKPSTL